MIDKLAKGLGWLTLVMLLGSLPFCYAAEQAGYGRTWDFDEEGRYREYGMFPPPRAQLQNQAFVLFQKMAMITIGMMVLTLTLAGIGRLTRKGASHDEAETGDLAEVGRFDRRPAGDRARGPSPHPLPGELDVRRELEDGADDEA